MELKQKSTMENVLKDRDVVASMLKSQLGIELMSNSRKRSLVEARAAFSYAFLERGYTLKAVGKALNKDHTTIMHLRSKFEAEVSQSDRMRIIYEHISKRISNRGPIVEVNNTIQKLELENAMLKRKIAESRSEDPKLKEIFDIIRERMPIGAEEEVKKRLYWMLNTVNEELKKR